MYNIHQLSAGTEVVQEIAPQNAAANVDSTGVDMQGWDGVKFDLATGVLAAGGIVSMYAKESANANFSGEVNINYPNAVLASVNVPVANANSISVLDLYRPDLRYVRVRVVANANGSFVTVNSTRYRHTGVLPIPHAAYQTVFVQVS